ncbi:serine/threonine-protein kinase [Streptomyces sp. RGM 3693]|uniref:serine/threonine-protein kinase n=1 Tax=Streptomyces sp. RGM 3693 TaxID=3413284 RepID=UPI003D299130
MGSIEGSNSDALRSLAADEPQEISGYRLLARIGEGGMGSVYLSQTRGNQPVALKVIRREYAGDAEFRRRFQREVEVAQQVRGNHLVPVVDHDAHGEQPWLATTYVPGLALDDVLDSHGPLSLPTTFQLVARVARALETVHSAGVIHRDLKPGNILLDANGPWVIDFGIARAAEATQLTRSGGFIGTPQFMSPEHGLGAELTPATDVFSLGLIAAVTATGRHPYGAGGALTMATQIANTAQRPPELSGYPEALRTLLARTLAAEPAARPTPGEVAELCERALAGTSRDLKDWLPTELAAAIAHRKRQADRALAESAPARPDAMPRRPATYVPTQASGPSDGGPGGSVHTAPTQAASAPRSVPPEAAPSVPLWRRRAPLAMAAAVALVVAAGAVWAMSGNDASGNGAKAHAGASHGASGKATDTGPSPKHPKAGAGVPKRPYEPVFRDRPLVIGPPATGELITVDLDAPKVSPNGEIGDHDAELTYIQQYLTFQTPTAKSPGTTPEACREAVDTAPLPSELSNTALIKENPVTPGDVLCTVTSKGNLAMLKITKVTPTGQPFDPPGYMGRLTLWKPSA